MKINTMITLGLSALIAVAVAGCGKKEALPPAPAETPAAVQAPAPVVAKAPIAFKSVVLGNKLTSDKKVEAPMTSFGRKDTLYAVVETDGTGKAEIKAVWTFHKGGKTANVNETTQKIDADGPARHEFHISKPDGWPVGEYKLDVHFNGAPAGTQSFTVK